eukprot:9525363-Prorocentrum_lima.AAC.1
MGSLRKWWGVDGYTAPAHLCLDPPCRLDEFLYRQESVVRCPVPLQVALNPGPRPQPKYRPVKHVPLRIKGCPG